MIRTTKAIAVGVLATGVWGCREQVPLPRPITCSQVLEVRVGMTPEDVHALIGTPVSANYPWNGGDPRVTHWERYSSGPAPDYLEYKDDLMAGYAEGTLVRLSAGRVVGRVVDPAGGNPRLAYRLSLTEDGEVRREFGPAFEEVFQCEPGWARPTDE